MSKLQALLRRHNQINHHLHWIRPSSFPFCSPSLEHPLTTVFSSSSSLLHSSIGFSNITKLTVQSPSKLFSSSSFAGKSTSSNGSFRFFYSSEQNPHFSMFRAFRKKYSSSSSPASRIRVPQTSSPWSLGIPRQGGNYGGFRFFSSKFSDFRKVDGGFAKKVFDKPAIALSSAFSRYSEAVGLQLEAFFKRNFLFLLGVAGVLVCTLLWRIMFGIANTFVGLSEGMAKYGFLALSSAIVAFAVSSFICRVYCIFSTVLLPEHVLTSLLPEHVLTSLWN